LGEEKLEAVRPSTKPRIVVDQDEVICAWTKRIVEWYNEDKGTSYTRDDVKAWNVTDSLPDSRDFIRSCMRYPEFYRDLEPMPGAIEGMMHLCLRYDVIIATAVPKSAPIAMSGKFEWIRRNMPFFPLDNFVSIHRKYLLDGDLLIDDGPHNIEPWLQTGRPAILFDAPWNEKTRFPSSIGMHQRARNWKHLIQLVDDKFSSRI
jgi:5'(3')-deoxyribonucleotidase